MTFTTNIENTGTAGWKEQTLPIAYSNINSYVIIQGCPIDSDNVGSNTTMSDTVIHKMSSSKYKIYLGASGNLLAKRAVFTIGY